VVLSTDNNSSGNKPQTVTKDDDQYEMAIRFRKDEDFSGWYQEVSCHLWIGDMEPARQGSS
jgi:antibiotic biosynthesis monooxygenase (ABM) superfamily enzyme